MSRYSQLYIERGKRAADSKRARVRLYTLFTMIVPENEYGAIQRLLSVKLGISLVGYGELKFKRFYDKANTQDILDSITIVYDYLNINQNLRGLANAWRQEVATIFDEEHLSYKVDDRGIVRPFVDAELEANRASAIEALDQPRFAGCRSEFDAAFRHLKDGKGKEALRMMFPAVETAAKVLFPRAFARLMPNEVERHVKPMLEQRYRGNQPALDAGRQLLDGMKDWINAAQPYRHGQQIEQLAEPPQDFVVAHLSAGATYLRWMIELCSPPDT